MSFIPRKYSPEDTLSKIRQWCDKAERAHWDVRNKLINWGVPSGEREEIISTLIQYDLLNEERYAEAFANDHFRFRQWGAKKIELALRRKGVSSANIQKALKRIPKEDALETMQHLLKRKQSKWTGLQAYQKKIKAIRFLLSKGYGSEEASDCATRFFGGE